MDIATAGTVDLRSSGDVLLSLTGIHSNGSNTPFNVYMSAGDGGLGLNHRVAIADSQITTNGGEIFAGGPVTIEPPFSNGYAPASGDNGVRVSNSTLDAGLGDVFLYGYSVAGGGIGVTVENLSVLSGQNVIVDGEAVGAGSDGARIESGSLLVSPYFVVVVGKGPQFGVVIDNGASLEVAPSFNDPGALLRIVGESTGSQYGTYMYRPGGSGPSTLKATNGAKVEVSGFNPGGAPSLGIFGTSGELFPVIDGLTGGSINLIANKDPINFNTLVNVGHAWIQDAVITASAPRCC